MPKLPGETQGHFEMRVFGHKLGCDVQKSIDETNRRLGIGEITEFVPTVSLKQLRAAASVDLSKYDSPVSDQDGIGDCCAEASINCFEWLQKNIQGSFFAGSRMAQYYWCLVHDGSNSSGCADTGTNTSTADWVMTNNGVAHSSLWPFSENCNTAPTSGVVSDAAENKQTASNVVSGSTSGDGATTVANCKATLASGSVFYAAFDFWENYYDAETNGGKFPAPSGSPVGGHCMEFCGYDDAGSNLDGSTGYFKCKNSWGTSTGDNGYYYMPYNIATGIDSGGSNSQISAAYVITGESEIVTPTPPSPTPTPTGGTQITYTIRPREYRGGYR
jgi:C1A family cysteine protease